MAKKEAAPPKMSDREIAIRQRLKDDFIHYASRCLKVRPKESMDAEGKPLGLVPFELNRAQMHTHQLLEKQKGETGKVRAIVLKGRQQGMSTLIGGRLYHRTTHTKGVQTFILTHALDATQNLFKMAQRYYENTPDLVKPSITISNSKELIFGNLDSGYKVGTAENKGVGRSSTIQLFHGSECAFWNNAAEHAAGIMQAVPDAKGTEIILESTANGVGNYFHQMWQKAEAGDSDFIAIFVPWFWQEEYTRDVPSGFSPTEDERELIEHYGLTYEQLVWRRKKVVDLSINGVNGERLFKQEYPCIVGSQRVGTNEGILPIQDVKAIYLTNSGYIKKQWCSGDKETIKITTELGYSIECTLNHRFKMGDGSFKEAKDLLGDMVLLTAPKTAARYHYELEWQDMPCTTNTTIIDEDMALFLGVFMGDGSYSGDTLSIVYDKRDPVSILKGIALIDSLFGLQVAQREVSTNGIEIRVYAKKLKKLFEAMGIIERREYGIRRKVHVPDCIWRSSLPNIKAFLRGLFDADGFAGHETPRISFFSKHEQFCKDVQLLLLSCNITSKRNHVEKKAGNGLTYMGNELVLRATESRVFGETIGFISDRKNERIKVWLEGSMKGRRALPILFTDMVTNITPMGMQTVYDLEMNNEEHVFDTQGIVVHNCNATEAFQLTGEDTYIQSDMVMRARKAHAERYGKLVLGVDPARFGDDRTAIVRRQGRQAWGLETYIKKDTMEITGIVHSVYNAEKPDKIFVDVGGLGAGVVDRLNELLPKGIVVAVNAGSTPLNARAYLNKRAEMWGLMREWLDDNQAVQIPDSDELHADLCNIRYKIDSNSRLVMEQKADMKKRGIRSSDCADSLCLTFAQPATALNNINTSSNLAGKIMQTNKLILNSRGVLYGNVDQF